MGRKDETQKTDNFVRWLKKPSYYIFFDWTFSQMRCQTQDNLGWFNFQLTPTSEKLLSPSFLFWPFRWMLSSSCHALRLLCESFDGPFFTSPIGLVKNRKFVVKWKIFLFSIIVQDYGNRTVDICLAMQAVGLPMHSLSIWIRPKLRSFGSRLDFSELITCVVLTGHELG